MGSKNGGAVRKLQDKAKQQAMKTKLGTQKGVLARGGNVGYLFSLAMHENARATLVNGKLANPDYIPKDDTSEVTFVAKKYKPLPKKDGYVYRPFKPRGGSYSGCILKRK